MSRCLRLRGLQAGVVVEEIYCPQLNLNYGQ